MLAPEALDLRRALGDIPNFRVFPGIPVFLAARTLPQRDPPPFGYFRETNRAVPPRLGLEPSTAPGPDPGRSSREDPRVPQQ